GRARQPRARADRGGVLPHAHGKAGDRMTQVTEVAPDLFRISTFVPEADLQFNQFLVRDDEPLLFHTGLRKMFPVVRDAVAKVIATGRYRFRYCRTPHVPHGWDAGLLFEETERTLLCSDLLQQNGEVEPLTTADVIGRFRDALLNYQVGAFANYLPYTPMT